MRLRRTRGTEPDWIAFWLAALLILALTSCGGGGGGAPEINEFVAEPSSVAEGETVILRWKVENFEGGRLRLESSGQDDDQPSQLGEVTAQSSIAVVVEETTTYRLIAAGSGGTATRETTVTVQGSRGGEGPEITFFRASPTSTSTGGAPVTLEWEVPNAKRVVIDPPGREVAASGTLEVRPYVSTVYTLHASDDHGTSLSTLTVEVDSADRLIFLVAGQSNASGAGLEEGGLFPTGDTEQPEEGVLMLTPGLEWVQASEPSHAGFDPDYRHSFLVRLGKEVRSATGMDIFLVPSAVGGSPLGDWQPGDDYFQEAVARARYASNSLGVPVSAVVWYQGESDTKSESRRRDFVENTNDVFEGFRSRLEAPPVIFVQLSKRLWSEELDEPGDNVEGHNLAYQVVREQQRLMEAGARSSELGNTSDSDLDRPYYRMVVSHDLPMSDAKHLSAEGQRVLGERIANSYLQIIDDPASRGLGPRLDGLTLDSEANAILVDLSTAVNEHSDYDNYFAVFQDGSEREDFSLRLDPQDQSIVRLEFPPTPLLTGNLEVRYMPPQGTPLYTGSSNVVKARDSGLPLPAFGMPVEDLPEGSIPGLRMPGD